MCGCLDLTGGLLDENLGQFGFVCFFWFVFYIVHEKLFKKHSFFFRDIADAEVKMRNIINIGKSGSLLCKCLAAFVHSQYSLSASLAGFSPAVSHMCCTSNIHAVKQAFETLSAFMSS